MKVLIVEPLGDGGIAHYTYNLISNLENSGVECHLYTNSRYEFASTKKIRSHCKMFRLAHFISKHIPIMEKELGVSNIIRRIFKLIEYPINAMEAVMLTKQLKCLVVHIQSVNITEIIMVLAFRLIGNRVVFTAHNVVPLHKSLRFYNKIFYSLMNLFCDTIIIHTEAGKNQLQHYYKVNKNKISVIQHGDYSFFVPETLISAQQAKKLLGIGPETKTILFFGAIRANKGLETLLYSLLEIKRYIQSFKLLIVGEECEDFRKYDSIINENNLIELIWKKLMYVPNEDVSRFFFAADVVALPYKEIAASGVLQIGLAFGKPIIASNLDGFHSAIINNHNGFLVEPGSPSALAKGITTILQDQKLRIRMGRASLNLSKTKFTWNVIAQKTIDIYKSL